MAEEARQIHVLRALGDALAGAHPTGGTAGIVAATLARELALGGVAVWFLGDERPALAGRGGELSHARPPATPGAAPDRLPCVRLAARGRTVGLLVAEPAPGGRIDSDVV